MAIALADLLRERRHDGGSTEAALEDALGSLLAGFVRGFERGKTVVIAVRWSTSPAEGRVTRLKDIKRANQGRPTCHPLRQRSLVAA